MLYSDAVYSYLPSIYVGNCLLIKEICMKQVELNEEFIVIAIPSSACELDIKAKVYQDGEVISVGRTIGFEEIREMIKEAQDGYIPSDAVFSLTDLGEDVLLELAKRYGYEEKIDG